MNDTDAALPDVQETITLITDLLATCLADAQPRSEYDLIRWLQEPGQAVFREEALRDTTTMFRTHFLVMHCLYRLRERWLKDHKGSLLISALEIRLMPSAQSGTQAVSEHDPLADYYLDLSQLATSDDDIDAMLNNFWRLMVIPEAYDSDLAVLGLTAPASRADIRQQYRRLAMQHHPDRGGDHSQFREITAAYQRLRNY